MILSDRICTAIPTALAASIKQRWLRVVADHGRDASFIMREIIHPVRNRLTEFSIRNKALWQDGLDCVQDDLIHRARQATESGLCRNLLQKCCNGLVDVEKR